MSDTDLELLARYTRCHAEDAFAEVVRRHLDLVYSAALRQVRSPQLAEEVAQSTFIKLAGYAPRLAPDTILTAWLYQVTRREAIDVVRREARRQLREQIALEMNAMNASADDWTQIEPLLDEAMHSLDDEDRTAVLLRYFENKSLREVGTSLGTTDDTARKRVNRAVDCLREFFAKRGVTVGASGLVIVISGHAVQAAPVGLALTISTAAALAGTTLTTAATAVTKTIVMTTTQKALIAAALAAAVGTSIYQARQASQLRDQVQILQQQQALLTEQLAQLQRANGRLLNPAAQTSALSSAQFNELLKFRGQSGVAQADSREIARLKSTLADQIGKADQLTNAMALGMEIAMKMRMTVAQAKLDLMRKTLALTDDQTRSIREVMEKHGRRQAEMAVEAMAGKMTPEQRQAIAAERRNQDDEIKALLTPDQLAAYSQFQHAEKAASADKSAHHEASQIAGDFSLSQEQQEQIRVALYQVNLHEPTRALNEEAIVAAKESGNVAEVISKNMELERLQLDEKLKILGVVLTPEQIDTYREKQMKAINMTAAAMRSFFPQKPAGTTN